MCVNDALLNYAALELPMGGWKTSGLGSRHGAAGSASTPSRHVQPHLGKEPHMYLTGR